MFLKDCKTVEKRGEPGHSGSSDNTGQIVKMPIIAEDAPVPADSILRDKNIF